MLSCCRVVVQSGGKNVKTFRWDHKLLSCFRWSMVDAQQHYSVPGSSYCSRYIMYYVVCSMLCATTKILPGTYQISAGRWLIWRQSACLVAPTSCYCPYPTPQHLLLFRSPPKKVYFFCSYTTSGTWYIDTTVDRCFYAARRAVCLLQHCFLCWCTHTYYIIYHPLIDG